MPIIKSAKKNLRKSKKRFEKNKKIKEELKKTIKDFQKLVTAKKTEEAKKMIPLVYKRIDKAVKKGIIKKNTASRKKSRLTHFCQK